MHSEDLQVFRDVDLLLERAGLHGEINEFLKLRGRLVALLQRQVRLPANVRGIQCPAFAELRKGESQVIGYRLFEEFEGRFRAPDAKLDVASNYRQPVVT